MSRNTVLFGNNQSSAPASRNLVEFRAGKMNLRGSWVHPDKRKGLVYITQSDDGLMHFCWKDRKTSVVEDDLIIFPEDVEFKRVSQCTTGRVFLLRFRSSSRKFFFWMQEPKDEKDEEHCRKVNDFLNNPPPQSNGGGSNTRNSNISAALQGLPESDMQGLLGNINQNDLMQLLVGMNGSRGGSGAGGGSGGILDSSHRPISSGTDSDLPSRVHSSPAVRGSSSRGGVTDSAASVTSSGGGTVGGEAPRPATAAGEMSGFGESGGGAGGSVAGGLSAAAAGNFQLSDLQNILNTLQRDAGSQEQPRQEVDLSEILDSEQLLPLLEKAEIRDKLKPHLPQQEGLSAEEELQASLRSPQLRQSIRAFGAALATGELAPVISQFNLGAAVNEAAQKGDVAGFAKALQEASKEKDGPKEEEKMDES